MRYGDYGDRFYFILRGTVEIQVPFQKTISIFNKLEPEINQTKLKLKSLDFELADVHREIEIKKE
jgi:hypothetical protein